MSTVAACDGCVRRAWLLAALAPHLDLVWKSRRPLRDVLALGDHELVMALGGTRREHLVTAYEAFDARAARERCVVTSTEAVCVHDDRFPQALRTGPGAPRLLHVVGDGGLGRLTALVGGDAGGPRAVVSIVGARTASPEALEMARGLGCGLARAGVLVVSGMALGVDSAAHAGALEAGGPTIAVLAGGAETAYPRSKAGLHRAIVRAGLVVSELPPGFTPFRWSFPARNRIIAGLAAVTIVVEAAERSGSLITADFAQELGREVAAVPGRATSPKARGTNTLIKDGASVVLDVEDALDAVLGFDRPRPAAVASAAAPALAPALARLLTAVADGRDTLAVLARTPAEADDARAGLAELELRGFVVRAAGGRYVVRAA